MHVNPRSCGPVLEGARVASTACHPHALKAVILGSTPIAPNTWPLRGLNWRFVEA